MCRASNSSSWAPFSFEEICIRAWLLEQLLFPGTRQYRLTALYFASLPKINYHVLTGAAKARYTLLDSMLENARSYFAV